MGRSIWLCSLALLALRCDAISDEEGQITLTLPRYKFRHTPSNGHNEWIRGPSQSLYQFHSGEQSWLSAREFCLGQNADLVSVNALEQFNWLLKHYAPRFPQNNERLVQIGLIQEDDGTWKWLDGTALDDKIVQWTAAPSDKEKRCAILRVNEQKMEAVDCDDAGTIFHVNRFVCQRSHTDHIEQQRSNNYIWRKLENLLNYFGFGQNNNNGTEVETPNEEDYWTNVEKTVENITEEDKKQLASIKVDEKEAKEVDDKLKELSNVKSILPEPARREDIEGSGSEDSETTTSLGVTDALLDSSSTAAPFTSEATTAILAEITNAIEKTVDTNSIVEKEDKELGEINEEIKGERLGVKKEIVEEKKAEESTLGTPKEQKKEELNKDDVKQESKIEEIKPAEPKKEVLKIEESKIEEPKKEDAKIEEPKLEKKEEPKIEGVKTEELKIEDPKKEENKVEEPKQEKVQEELKTSETPKIEASKKVEKKEEKIEVKKEEPKIEEKKNEEIKAEEPKKEEATTLAAIVDAKKEEAKAQITDEKKDEIKEEPKKEDAAKVEEHKNDEDKTLLTPQILDVVEPKKEEKEIKPEETKKEESKVTEPAKEEPKIEEAKKEEKSEEPKREEIKAEEPKVEKPKIEEAKKEAVKIEEPKKEEQKIEEKKDAKVEAKEEKQPEEVKLPEKNAVEPETSESKPLKELIETPAKDGIAAEAAEIEKVNEKSDAAAASGSSVKIDEMIQTMENLLDKIEGMGILDTPNGPVLQEKNKTVDEKLERTTVATKEIAVPKVEFPAVDHHERVEEDFTHATDKAIQEQAELAPTPETTTAGDLDCDDDEKDLLAIELATQHLPTISKEKEAKIEEFLGVLKTFLEKVNHDDLKKVIEDKKSKVSLIERMRNAIKVAIERENKQKAEMASMSPMEAAKMEENIHQTKMSDEEKEHMFNEVKHALAAQLTPTTIAPSTDDSSTTTVFSEKSESTSSSSSASPSTPPTPSSSFLSDGSSTVALTKSSTASPLPANSTPDGNVKIRIRALSEVLEENEQLEKEKNVRDKEVSRLKEAEEKVRKLEEAEALRKKEELQEKENEAKKLDKENKKNETDCDTAKAQNDSPRLLPDAATTAPGRKEILNKAHKAFRGEKRRTLEERRKAYALQKQQQKEEAEKKKSTTTTTESTVAFKQDKEEEEEKKKDEKKAEITKKEIIPEREGEDDNESSSFVPAEGPVTETTTKDPKEFEKKMNTNQLLATISQIEKLHPSPVTAHSEDDSFTSFENVLKTLENNVKRFVNNYTL